MIPIAASESSDRAEPAAAEVPWKLRVEEPINRFVYYPIARQLVRLLVKTPITANQVTLIQPLIAALACYLLTLDGPYALVAAALVFELRSMLDCADGTLARAKNQASANGHALDGLCDWLGVVFLYLGIYLHFMLHPPPTGIWSAYLPMGAIVAISLFQGAMRSFSADYYMRKFGSIMATGQDATVEELRATQLTLSPDSPFTKKAEAWIGRCGHLAFQHEFFDVERTSALNPAQAQALIDQRDAPLTKLIAFLASISSGDAYVRITIISLLLGHAWAWDLQLFWASIGVVWILAFWWLNAWFLRRAIAGAPDQQAEVVEA